MELEEKQFYNTCAVFVIRSVAVTLFFSFRFVLDDSISCDETNDLCKIRPDNLEPMFFEKNSKY